MTGRTALWLFGALDGPMPYPIHVAVPNQRQCQSQPGIRITRTRSCTFGEANRGSPPARSMEDALLDACETSGSGETVLDMVFRVCQRRLSTARRIADVLQGRSRCRWRRLLEDVLSDVGSGAASRLEQRFLRDVERAHGLPPGDRNKPEAVDGASRYRDVRYKKWRTVIELDGRGAHPEEERFRDFRRDNRVTLDGDSTLHYGWHDVALCPCDVAVQAILLLQAQGWPGQPQACGPSCPVSDLLSIERDAGD